MIRFNGHTRRRLVGSTAGGCRAGFSLVELLVVVAIIGVLVAILIPTVAKVRISGQTAATRVLLSNLGAAIEQYKSDNGGAFPGPLPDAPTAGGGPFAGGLWSDLPRIGAVPSGFTLTPAAPFDLPTGALPSQSNIVRDGAGAAPTIAPFASITGTHNLVLGLLGGLYSNNGVPTYNPALVGRGPNSMNAVVMSRTTPAYLDGNKDLSWHDEGQGKVGNVVFAGGIKANDCPIPSFVDRYADPMPVLYLRARPGLVGRKLNEADASATVVGYYTTVNPGQSLPYNIAHVLGYTTSSIGAPQSKLNNRNPSGAPFVHGLRDVDENGSTSLQRPGGTPTASAYRYPYEANAYLSDPSFPGQPRKKDEYILISAGPDRIYGTSDDITNFGDVVP